MTKEEEMLKYLDEATPQQILRDVNIGREPSPAEIVRVNQLQKKTKLPTGVINVLIEYVYLTSTYKESCIYNIEEIAHDFARANLKDVKEALYFVRKNHKKYSEWNRIKNTQNVDMTKAEKERIKAIQSAIDIGLDNENLGKFVRTMFNGDTSE